MKFPHQRVNFVDASYLLCALERIDDTGVTARADYDEPAVADPEASGVLVPVLIRHRLSRELLFRKMMARVRFCIAARSLRVTKLDKCVREHAFNAGARNGS